MDMLKYVIVAAEEKVNTRFYTKYSEMNTRQLKSEYGRIKEELDELIRMVRRKSGGGTGKNKENISVLKKKKEEMSKKRDVLERKLKVVKEILKEREAKKSPESKKKGKAVEWKKLRKEMEKRHAK